MGQRIKIFAVVPLSGSNLVSMEGVDGRFIQSRLGGIRIKATTTAAGVTGSVKIGQKEVTQLSPISVEVAAGRGPITDDLYFCEAVGRGGDEVFVRLFNSTAGALTVTYTFEQVAVRSPQEAQQFELSPPSFAG